MNKEVYFENVCDIGNLYLEKVLNVFEDENIVFLCTDQTNNYYFAICYEFRERLAWVLCKVDDVLKLTQILFKSVDMHSAYKNSSTNLIEITYENDSEQARYVSYEDFNKMYLPTPGTYLKPDDEISLYAYNLLHSKAESSSSVSNYERFVDYDICESNYLSLNTYDCNILDSSTIELKYSYIKNSRSPEFSRIILDEAS